LAIEGFSQAGTFNGAGILPEIGFTLIAPAPMFSTSRFLRSHNKALKEVLKAVLFEWHAKTLPKHFVASAATRYKHHPRQESTRHRKREKRHHEVDLVNSGKMSRRMKSRIPRATTSGNASGVITARMRYKPGFPVSRDTENPAHVTISKMMDEIATWTESEQQWAAERVAHLYSLQIEYELRNSPRVLREYKSKRLYV